MHSRRNSDQHDREEVDLDMIDLRRSVDIGNRLRFTSERLMNEKIRKVGLDVAAVDRQIVEYQVRNNNVRQERLKEREHMTECLRSYTQAEKELESTQRRNRAEYAKFLESQWLEKRIKEPKGPDFEPSSVIGGGYREVDDPTRLRQLNIAHKKELLVQIQTKELNSIREKDIQNPPVPKSDKILEYQSRVREEFIKANYQIVMERKLVQHTMSDRQKPPPLVSLPDTVPHTRATDFKGLTVNETREFLKDNEAILASKKLANLQSDLESIEDRLAIETAAKNEADLVEKLKNEQRESKKNCLSISSLNNELRGQKCPPTDFSYFINKFGTSLIYSLLE